jgi:uncharacterized protein YukE
VAGTTEINEEVLSNFVTQSDGPVQRHQALLGKLRAVQTELKSGFKGAAGDAVNLAFDETITTGEAAGRKHEEIIQGVVNAKSKFLQQDADAMAAVSRMNADLSSIGAGSLDGQVNSQSPADHMLANPKVKTDF